MGEMLVDLESGGAAEGSSKGLVFHARDESIALINMTVSGTIAKSGKQPLL